MRVEAEPTGRGAAVPAHCRSSKGGGALEFEHAQRPKRQHKVENKNAGKTLNKVGKTLNKVGKTLNKKCHPTHIRTTTPARDFSSATR